MAEEGSCRYCYLLRRGGCMAEWTRQAWPEECGDARSKELVKQEAQTCSK